MKDNKSFVMAFSASLAIAFLSAGFVVANPLKDYAWKNRVIIVSASVAHIDSLTKQSSILMKQEAALLERDMVLIEVSGNNASVKVGREKALDHVAIIEHLGLKTDRFGIVLIGKDTGIKRRSTEPVAVRQILDLVDSMPMRQREMNR